MKRPYSFHKTYRNGRWQVRLRVPRGERPPLLGVVVKAADGWLAESRGVTYARGCATRNVAAEVLLDELTFIPEEN